jgi:hypothetical protein
VRTLVIGSGKERLPDRRLDNSLEISEYLGEGTCSGNGAARSVQTGARHVPKANRLLTEVWGIQAFSFSVAISIHACPMVPSTLPANRSAVDKADHQGTSLKKSRNADPASNADLDRDIAESRNSIGCL